MKNKIEFKVKATRAWFADLTFFFPNGKTWLEETKDSNIVRELCPKNGELFKVTIQRVKQ